MADAGGLSKKQIEDVNELSEKASYRAEAAGRLATRVSNVPLQTMEIVQKSISTATRISQSTGQLLAILLVLFILHQVFLWVDRDPEKAFDNGALFFEAAELSWDTTSIFYNAGVDVVNAGVLPVWNAASFYIAEPLIVLVLEVFSLAFTRQHWQGLFEEADFPYNGLDCTANAKVNPTPTPNPSPNAHNGTTHPLFFFQSAEWCGRASAYAARLEMAEKAEGYASSSGTYAAASRRALGSLLPPYSTRTNTSPPVFADLDDTYVFGISTARRLAEIGADYDDNFVAPSFDTAALNSALLDFGMLFITLGSTTTDVFFAVSIEVLTQVFSVLVDAFFFVIRSLMTVLKMLVSTPRAPQTSGIPQG